VAQFPNGELLRNRTSPTTQLVLEYAVLLGSAGPKEAWTEHYSDWLTSVFIEVARIEGCCGSRIAKLSKILVVLGVLIGITNDTEFEIAWCIIASEVIIDEPSKLLLVRGSRYKQNLRHGITS